ncbi:MAG: ribose 5-phosphate isomerase B [Chitinophagaceae bacterium]|nr:MAG: ribose 5-phosphate isomerase B [Chitinophagaceae bacterium]
MQKISIGSDHAGFELKSKIIDYLKEKQIDVKDKGTFSEDSVDYPDFIHPVAEAVEKDKNVIGIVICGSANGACITANKHQKIRAALCWSPEIATLARQHNDANVLCLPARFLETSTAIEILDLFLNTDFEGGRHQKRVDKIPVSPITKDGN